MLLYNINMGKHKSKHSNDDRCKCRCPEPKLEPIGRISYNSSDREPLRFALGECYGKRQIKVIVTVCVSESWRPITFEKCLKTSREGEFTIKIPKWTTEIRVVVRICPDNCHDCITVRYVNAPCGSTPLSYLDGPELDMFTMLRTCVTNCVKASAVDHAGAKEQAGPCFASRALAMAIVASFDACNAITQKYTSYLGLPPADPNASPEAASSQADHDVLVHLFPAQIPTFDLELTSSLALIPDGPSKTAGIAVGKKAAIAMLAQRANDGSAGTNQIIGPGPNEFHVNPDPGYWSMDPISNIPVAVGSLWGRVKPFVIESATQFRCPVPPAMDSQEYTLAFNEVSSLGGDRTITKTVRSEDETFAGIYWGYDGSPDIGTPPNLYNQISLQLCTQMKLGAMEMGRVCALINLSMVDSSISAWESKYYYQLWRPVTAIRRADEDGNPQTHQDPNYSPLGAPASNTTNPNFTPPFPAYPSGHATFGGGIFQVMRKVFGTDEVPFTFVSDEYNGKTTNNKGIVRPLRPRSFITLSQAEEENGQGRIFLGIHWNQDKTSGIVMGQQVADYVLDHAYKPL